MEPGEAKGLVQRHVAEGSGRERDQDAVEGRRSPVTQRCPDDPLKVKGHGQAIISLGAADGARPGIRGLDLTVA